MKDWHYILLPHCIISQKSIFFTFHWWVINHPLVELTPRILFVLEKTANQYFFAPSPRRIFICSTLPSRPNLVLTVYHCIFTASHIQVPQLPPVPTVTQYVANQREASALRSLQSLQLWGPRSKVAQLQHLPVPCLSWAGTHKQSEHLHRRWSDCGSPRRMREISHDEKQKGTEEGT